MAIIFLCVGLLLLFLEFYLPGAILGTIGVFLIVGAVLLFVFEATSASSLLIFVGASAILTVAVVQLALFLIKRTKRSETIFQDKSQVGFIASTYPKEAIGKNAVALTDLKPGGYILFEGKKIPAISVSGYIERNSEVKILSGTGDALNVTKKELKNGR